MVADPLGLLLDSRDYLAPLVTPWEAHLAFTGQSLLPGAPYHMDFTQLLVCGGACVGGGRGRGGDCHAHCQHVTTAPMSERRHVCEGTCNGDDDGDDGEGV